MTHWMVVAAGAMAVSVGTQAADCVLRGGVHHIEPKGNNNATVGVKSGDMLSVNGACFVAPNVAIDVLGSLPFKHDIVLAGTSTKVGSTEHLPPTVSVQYHFAPQGKTDFYLGAGLNYTLFFNKKTTGPLAGTKLMIENSFGVALQAGVDFQLSNNWVLGLDLRWANIQPDAKVNLGTSMLNVGKVKIDPTIYGLTIGKRLKFGG